MALRLAPITAQLGKLSIGISRTSIRFKQTKTKKEKAKDKAREKDKEREKRRPEKEDTRKKDQLEPIYPEGHGEKIFIFSHFLNGMTVYSHDPVLKANRALKQLPFHGRKMKPSKLRKDYWRPLALIQFPAGLGAVGRSVFQRLRECRRLHELDWDDSILYDVETRRTLKRVERGRALANQRPNAVADMAAVLGGLGKGSKMWAPEPEPEPAAETEAASEEAAAAAAAEKEVAVAVKGKEKKKDKKKKGSGIDTVVPVSDADKVAVETEDGSIRSLVKVTVWWADSFDRFYAKQWPKNVTHHLFDEAQMEPLGVGGYSPKPKDHEGGGEGAETRQPAHGPILADEFRASLQEKLQERAQ